MHASGIFPRCMLQSGGQLGAEKIVPGAPFLAKTNATTFTNVYENIQYKI